MEQNAIVLADGTDADVIAVAEDPLEIAVQVFYVRGGRVRGQRGWVADRVDDADLPELLRRFIIQVYDPEASDGIPREVLVPQPPDDLPALVSWLSDKRGSKVSLRMPQRGDKRILMETVARNAGQSLATHKTKRASDFTTRTKALEEIQAALGSRGGPAAHRVLRRVQPARHRSRCFDGGVRGRLAAQERLPPVCDQGFRRAKRRRRDARDDHSHASSDCSMSAPTPRRWISAGLRTAKKSVARCWSTPTLAAHASSPTPLAWSSSTVARRRSLPPSAPWMSSASTTSPLSGLAKRLEEVWVPGQEDPVILARTSEGLYLLQRVRDEAHRFAITHHRNRRSKSMVESVLDDVPGLGEVRRKVLMRHFGSLKKLRAASVDDIAALPGFGQRTATAISDALEQSRGTSAPAVNMTTGEILDDDDNGVATVPAARPDHRIRRPVHDGTTSR